MLSAIICMYIASGTHTGVDLYTSMRSLLEALPIGTVYSWYVVDTIALFTNVGDSFKPL